MSSRKLSPRRCPQHLSISPRVLHLCTLHKGSRVNFYYMSKPSQCTMTHPFNHTTSHILCCSTHTTLPCMPSLLSASHLDTQQSPHVLLISSACLWSLYVHSASMCLMHITRVGRIKTFLIPFLPSIHTLLNNQAKALQIPSKSK